MPTAQKLLSVDEVDALIARSHTQPVLIFKHSLTCPISSLAHRELERYLAGRPEGDAIAYHLIEIQNARPVSNAVAEKTGVRHESPQAILLRDGAVVWHDSHNNIRVDTLSAAAAKV